MADEFLEQHYPFKTVLRILNLPRSSYYYKPTGGKAGKRACEFVWNHDGIRCSFEQIILEIKRLFEGEFVDYGYYKTYIHLTRTLGYKIGSTRVYKLMKDNRLLKFERNGRKKSN